MNFSQYIFDTPSPVVFGPKHLTGTAFVVILIVIALLVLLVLMKNTNHDTVLKVTTIFLLLLEAIKYTHAFVTGGTFPVYYIPMQLCSFSLYLMPIVAFGKGKYKKFFTPVAFNIGLLAGLIVLFYPVTVLGGEYSWSPFVPNIIPIISFVYHGTMIFFSLYLLFAKLYKPNIKDFGKVYVALAVFAGMAMVTNALAGTDMMFLNTGSGNPFQFVLLEYGRAIYYVFMLALAAILLFFPFAPSVFRSLLVRKTKSVQETD